MSKVCNQRKLFQKLEIVLKSKSNCSNTLHFEEDSLLKWNLPFNLLSIGKSKLKQVEQGILLVNKYHMLTRCSHTRERNPMLAHNAATHAHKLMTSRNTCWPIQETSLLFTYNRTSHTQQLVTSRFTTRYIKVKGLLVACNATTPALELGTSRDTC